MANIKYWLWLSRLSDLSGPVKTALLAHFENPEAIYYADREERALVEGITSHQLDALEQKSTEEADRILGDCQRLGLRIITREDTDYPDRLRSIFDPPLLLYVQGHMPVFDDEVAIAMVGTRRCSPYGERLAEKLSFELASQGALIVSGLAKGLDAMCHQGAIRAGGVTAAVIGGGHDIKYPYENRYLYEDIAASGVILSEYPPGTEPKGSHFPVRNRIISGLCLGTVVVEAPRRSGALITAHTALEQGRDVFAVPGPVDVPSSEGTNHLLLEGAIPALSAAGILAEYAAHYPHKLHLKAVEAPEPLGQRHRKDPAPAAQEQTERPEEEAAPELPVLDLGADHGLTDDQIRILQALEGGTMHVDDIIEATQIPARRVLSALTLLEVEDRVRQESGKRFTLAVTLKI